MQHKFTLRVKALIYLVLPTIIGIVSMVLVAGYYETTEHKERLAGELAVQLSTTKDVISELAVLGDYETLRQTLRGIVAHPDTKSIKFIASQGSEVLEESGRSVPIFPVYFGLLFGGEKNIKGRQDIEVGGVKYGTIEIEMDFVSFANAVWKKLSHMVLMLCVVLLLGALLLFRLFGKELLPSLKAIEDCSKQIGSGAKGVQIDKEVSPEIQKVLQSFNEMAAAVENQKEFLKAQNLLLETKVQEETRKRVEQERLLMQQSRLAALGEMIGNIAHQWRQPLNALAIGVQDLKMAGDFRELNQEYLLNFTNNSMRTIKEMSKMIDDFRTFFAPNKAKEDFRLRDVCDEAIRLLKYDTDVADIGLTVSETEAGIVCYGYKRELTYALLNIVSNAKEALSNNSVDDPRIDIEISVSDDFAVISIADNAGGVSEEILEKIFDPYFTTKHQSQGTGLGLYIAKMTVEQHMNGRLAVFNTGSGVCFQISIPQHGTNIDQNGAL